MVRTELGSSIIYGSGSHSAKFTIHLAGRLDVTVKGNPLIQTVRVHIHTIMVVQGPANRNHVHRSRSVDGIDGRGERNRRIRRGMDCPDISMENSDGSQECVLPLAKRRPEKRQEIASLRSYQDPPTGHIRNMVRPGLNVRQNYQRANSAEELSYGERTPNSALSKNGVIQRRLLRRRSFGGLEPSDDSELPGELTPPQIPRNYKCCEVVMAEIVEKLKGDSHGKEATQLQRSDPLDHLNSVCRPLVSVSPTDSKWLAEKCTPSRMKRRGSTGHLKDTNTKMLTHSTEGQHFLPSYLSVSNHELSTGQNLCGALGKHPQETPKQSPKCIERRIRRERSISSYSRRDIVAREKHKLSPVELPGHESFASENTNAIRAKHTDQIPSKSDSSPLTVQHVATDYCRTNDRRRRQRGVHRNFSGPLAQPLQTSTHGLATAVPKEDLFLIWLKQQNCNPPSEDRISKASLVNTAEGNERQTRQGATTLSDRRAMRQVRRRNSQTT